MDGILRFRAMAEHSQRGCMEPRAMTLQQQAEATAVAGLGGNDKLGVGRADTRFMTHSPRMRLRTEKFESNSHSRP